MGEFSELVSINLTTYNRADLLPRCLESVLRQSYENFEAIIIDDCSTDNTKEVVQKYQNKDTRIKYIRHETNLGNAKARNTAYRNSRGKYIAFMDDDDEWIDEKKIEKQVEIFDRASEKLGIVCSGVKLAKGENYHKKKQVQAPKNIKAHILSGNGIIYSPTVMTKKKILKEVDGFDENMPRGVDSDFYRTCIVKLGYQVHFMPEITTIAHQYGSDRMTPTSNIQDIKNLAWANMYLIYKYFRHYLFSPVALGRRLKITGINLLKLLK